MATIEDVEVIYEGWGRFLQVRLRMEDGAIVRQQVDDHGDGVAVLPYDPVRRMVTLVRQHRPGALYAGHGRMILEIPAGRLDSGEPENWARQETIEETGIRVKDLERVGAFWVAPGICTERLHIFLARYTEADKVSAGGGLAEENERILVEEIPISTIVAMADSGEIDDAKTFTAVQALRLKHPELCA